MKNLILTMLLSPMLFSGSPIIYGNTNYAQNLAPNGLIIGAGSVTVPSVAVSGSLTTGLYSAGANSVSLAANGVSSVAVSSANVVTIGPTGAIGSNTFAGNLIVGATSSGSTTGLAAGYVGEYIESIGSDTSLTSAQYSDGGATKITLTPGVWDIQATVDIRPAASTTITLVQGFVGTATGNSTSGVDTSRNFTAFQFAGVHIDRTTFATPMYRVAITANTDYYGKVYAEFLVSTCTGKSGIFARRVR